MNSLYHKVYVRLQIFTKQELMFRTKLTIDLDIMHIAQPLNTNNYEIIIIIKKKFDE